MTDRLVLLTLCAAAGLLSGCASVIVRSELGADEREEEEWFEASRC